LICPVLSASGPYNIAESTGLTLDSSTLWALNFYQINIIINFSGHIFFAFYKKLIHKKYIKNVMASI
jgi:hypothetical protein